MSEYIPTQPTERRILCTLEWTLLSSTMRLSLDEIDEVTAGAAEAMVLPVGTSVSTSLALALS